MQTPDLYKDTPLSLPVMFLLSGAIASAYIIGLFPDPMETDAAQYASISREMAETGNYLQVFHRYGNYLDKPPLLFWLSSVFISWFGNTAWAYKLPSVLFSLLGIWSVYKFTLIYYPKKAAIFSAFILASCQAWFMINNDVRTDTMLASAVIFSVWQMTRYLEYKNVWGLVLAGVGLGLAMLAKGPIGIMAPALAVGSHVIFARRIDVFTDPKWLLMLLIAGTTLIPMCYGLYQQYGNEGLVFFFWKQSFGRITGENEWRNDAGYFYFVHTFFWTFMPWCIMALVAFGGNIRTWVQNRFKTGKSLPETISTFGFILPFIALSFSHYKLPHYIFVTFPFAAVFCGFFLYDALEKKKSRKGRIALASLTPGPFVYTIISGLACAYVFSGFSLWAAITGLTLVSVFFLIWKEKGRTTNIEKWFFTSVLFAAGANISLNGIFYPHLLQYQPGKKAAEFIQENKPLVGIYLVSDHPLEFYADTIFPYIGSSNLNAFLSKNPDAWLYVDDFGLQEINNYGYQTEIKTSFERHHPALLSIDFLNPKTREKTLDHRHLVVINP